MPAASVTSAGPAPTPWWKYSLRLVCQVTADAVCPRPPAVQPGRRSAPSATWPARTTHCGRRPRRRTVVAASDSSSATTSAAAAPRKTPVTARVTPAAAPDEPDEAAAEADEAAAEADE